MLRDYHLQLLRGESAWGRGRVRSNSNIRDLCSSSCSACRCRPSRGLSVSARQLRLKPLYLCVSGLQQRVFAFDDGIFGLEGNGCSLKSIVLGTQGSVFALDDGVFDPYVGLELHHLRFGLLLLRLSPAKIVKIERRVEVGGRGGGILHRFS